MDYALFWQYEDMGNPIIHCENYLHRVSISRQYRRENGT
jgi:hypothetical protein